MFGYKYHNQTTPSYYDYSPLTSTNTNTNNTNFQNDSSKPSFFSSSSSSSPFVFGQGNNQQSQQHQSQQIDSVMISSVETKIMNSIQESKLAIMEELKRMNTLPSSIPSSKNTYIHTGITCDRCRKVSFSGDRYKCLFCKDFDLCEDCEKIKHVMITNIGAHTKDHSFIKIENTESFLKMMSSVSNAFTL